jgi:type VI protein secretion system component VasF
MTDVDELLSRLRNLEPIPLSLEFKASLRQRARHRVRRPVRRAPLASAAVFGTALVYLGWALHFASALYP